MFACVTPPQQISFLALIKTKDSLMGVRQFTSEAHLSVIASFSLLASFPINHSSILYYYIILARAHAHTYYNFDLWPHSVPPLPNRRSSSNILFHVYICSFSLWGKANYIRRLIYSFESFGDKFVSFAGLIVKTFHCIQVWQCTTSGENRFCALLVIPMNDCVLVQRSEFNTSLRIALYKNDLLLLLLL